MKELDSTEAPACNEEELLAWNKIETKKQNEMFAGLLEADKHIQNVWIDEYYIIIKKNIWETAQHYPYPLHSGQSNSNWSLPMQMTKQRSKLS